MDCNVLNPVETDALPGLPEICANGLRNSFQCGFDSETDELYCGDVGQIRLEEINLIE